MTVLRTVLAALALAIALAGCIDSNYPRGMFSGYVMGQTQDAIIKKIGQPESIDTSKADEVRLVYKNKTFDPDNMNAKDPRTIIILHKDASGNVVADEITYTLS
jgi:hypothetical protein